MTTSKAAVVCALACAACGPGKPKDQVAVIDVAAVNALVPPALRGQLVFERREIASILHARDTHYTLAAPKGWAIPSTKWSRFKSPDELSSVSLRVAAPGGFHAQDWAKVVDGDAFPAPEAGERVVKDERAPGRRTRILAGEFRVHVTVAWWVEGADRYHTCEASVDEALVAAAPAFERACLAVGVVSDD